jgi:hypothetical protein
MHVWRGMHVLRVLRGIRALMSHQSGPRTATAMRSPRASYIALANRRGMCVKVFRGCVPQAATTIASKVAVDQLVFSPISTAVFFVWANLAGGTPGSILSDLQHKLPPSVQASWALWVPAMTVNMSCVPHELRILFINATAIVWTNILSSMSCEPDSSLVCDDLSILAAPLTASACLSRPVADAEQSAFKARRPLRCPGQVLFAPEYSFISNWPLIDPLCKVWPASCAVVNVLILPEHVRRACSRMRGIRSQHCLAASASRISPRASTKLNTECGADKYTFGMQQGLAYVRSALSSLKVSQMPFALEDDVTAVSNDCNPLDPFAEDGDPFFAEAHPTATSLLVELLP